MFGKAVICAALAVAFPFGAGAASAETVAGKCAVRSTTHGKNKFVVLKCAKASAPGDYMIRKEVWERDDPAQFKALSPLAGRTYSCGLKREGASRDGGYEIERYSLEDCR